MDDRIRAVVQAIHDAPSLAALVVAGAGSKAVSWLLGVPGATRTVLDVSIPYSRRAMNAYLGWQPRKYAASSTALSLAAAAYSRAAVYNKTDSAVLGISCAAAIASDRPKKGAHRCHIGLWDGQTAQILSLTFEKGLRTRSEEEHIVSILLLRTLVQACGLDADLPVLLTADESVEVTRRSTSRPFERLLDGAVDSLTVYGPAAIRADEPLGGAIISGSFNPLHEGHLKLARVAEQRLGLPVVFEIAVHNVDKPSLTADEITDRMAQFTGERRRLALTREPLYVGKAALFPHTTFIVGYDTALRLVDPAYYDDDRDKMLAALDDIRAADCRFLVAGRLVDGRFKTAADLPLPQGYADLFDAIPEDEFRVDISSTELRERGYNSLAT